jgi:hypothetical protein
MPVRLFSFDPARVTLRSAILGAAVSALLLATGCATPVMPTGGPPDRTPPELVAADPAADAINVRADRLSLEFSKPIDEASLRQAISIAPDFERLPDIITRGRRVEIRFPEALRENTTYVVTIGTELRDLRNNRISAPITLAFATGAQLDEGNIAGWVRDPASGRGVPSVNLFGYVLPAEGALPDPRVTPPDYRTETDSQGSFRLAYLRDVPFFIVAVEDQNRNRRADPGERFASPFDPRVTPTPPGEEPPIVALYLTRVDTLAPEPVRVRPRNTRQIALRFSEAIEFVDPDPAAFSIAETVSGGEVGIEAVYPDEDVQQIAFDTAPMNPVEHRLVILRPEAVRDTAGNPTQPTPLTFTASSVTEIEPARLVGFEPTGRDTVRTLRPNEVAAVRFSRPPTGPPAPERISTLATDGSAIDADVSSDDGVRYVVRPATRESFILQVRQPDSLHAVRYNVLPADSLGDVTGRITQAPEKAAVVVELVGANGYTVRTAAADDGSFAVRNVPSGQYLLRIFRDDAGDGRWDGGSLAPYRAPALLRVIPTVRVRARWENEIDPIVLDPAAAPPPAAPLAPADQPGDAVDQSRERIDIGRPGSLR